MIRKTPTEIIAARILSIATGIWLFIAAVNMISDGNATVISTAFLLLSGVLVLALSGSVYENGPWNEAIVVTIFFAVAALQQIVIMGDFVPALVGAVTSLTMIACGILCATDAAKAWIWRNYDWI